MGRASVQRSEGWSYQSVSGSPGAAEAAEAASEVKTARRKTVRERRGGMGRRAQSNIKGTGTRGKTWRRTKAEK